MKIFPFFLFLLHFLGLVLLGQAPPPPPAPARDYFPEKWQEYSYAEFGFAIRAPAELKTTIELPESNAEKVRKIVFSSGRPTFIQYRITIWGLASSATDVEKVFDGVISSRFATVEKKNWIKNESTTRFDLPVRTFEVENAGRRSRGFVIVRGALIYTVEIITGSNDVGAMKSSNAYKEITDAFLDSFKFVSSPGLAAAVTGIDDGDNSVWKQYVSDDDGFKNNWPGTPKASKSEIKLSTRVVSQVVYGVKGDLVSYTATIQNHGMGSDDRKVADSIYDNWIRGFTERLGYKLIEKKEFSSADGSKGLEVRLVTEEVAVVGRAFFTHGRFYAFSGYYQRIYDPLPKIKAVIDRSINNFLGSVELFLPKKIREIVAEDLKLPEGFFGIVSGGKYINRFFGFEIEPLSNWIVASDEANRMLIQVSKDTIAAENEALLEKLRSPEKAIFTVSKKPIGIAGNSAMIIDTVRQVSENFDPLTAVKSTEMLASQVPSNRITVSSHLEKLSGRDAAIFEMSSVKGTLTYVTRMIGFKHENYLIALILTSTNDADAKELDTIVKSLKFIK